MADITLYAGQTPSNDDSATSYQTPPAENTLVDKLPLEILWQIWTRADNPNLLLVCKKLRDKLSSDHIYQWDLQDRVSALMTSRYIGPILKNAKPDDGVTRDFSVAALYDFRSALSDRRTTYSGFTKALKAWSNGMFRMTNAVKPNHSLYLDSTLNFISAKTLAGDEPRTPMKVPCWHDYIGSSARNYRLWCDDFDFNRNLAFISSELFDTDDLEMMQLESERARLRGFSDAQSFADEVQNVVDNAVKAGEDVESVDDCTFYKFFPTWSQYVLPHLSPEEYLPQPTPPVAFSRESIQTLPEMSLWRGPWPRVWGPDGEVFRTVTVDCGCNSEGHFPMETSLLLESDIARVRLLTAWSVLFHGDSDRCPDTKSLGHVSRPSWSDAVTLAECLLRDTCDGLAALAKSIKDTGKMNPTDLQKIPPYEVFSALRNIIRGLYSMGSKCCNDKECPERLSHWQNNVDGDRDINFCTPGSLETVFQFFQELKVDGPVGAKPSISDMQKKTMMEGFVGFCIIISVMGDLAGFAIETTNPFLSMNRSNTGAGEDVGAAQPVAPVQPAAPVQPFGPVPPPATVQPAAPAQPFGPVRPPATVQPAAPARPFGPVPPPNMAPRANVSASVITVQNVDALVQLLRENEQASLLSNALDSLARDLSQLVIISLSG